MYALSKSGPNSIFLFIDIGLISSRLYTTILLSTVVRQPSGYMVRFTAAAALQATLGGVARTLHSGGGGAAGHIGRCGAHASQRMPRCRENRGYCDELRASATLLVHGMRRCGARDIWSGPVLSHPIPVRPRPIPELCEPGIATSTASQVSQSAHAMRYQRRCASTPRLDDTRSVR